MTLERPDDAKGKRQENPCDHTHHNRKWNGRHQALHPTREAQQKNDAPAHQHRPDGFCKTQVLQTPG